MKSIDKRIFEYTQDDLYWAFDNKDPYYILNTNKNSSGRHVPVDPFPCAKHDKKLLRKFAENIEDKFPIGALVHYHILPHETTGRSNAWASYSTFYSHDEKNLREKYLMEGIVLFSGKRTICHPLMTKYLVAHEYGHIVDYWIRAKWKLN